MGKLVGIFGILVLIFEIYRWLRKKWIERILAEKKKGKKPRKPQVMRPKTELDCPYCVGEKDKVAKPAREMPVAWSERKGRGGRRKMNSTEGYFCSNRKCAYYKIADERIHALVWDGRHGKHEEIRDLRYQACGKKFTSRKNTILYRLKTHSEMVQRVLWLIALGMDASALEEVFGVREITIRAWLSRSGEQGRKLHDRMLVELELMHVQLDELRGNVKKSGQEVWVWTASDARTKLLVVLQVGGRTQEMAYGVGHEL
jgi:hypothetical protein